MTPPGRLVGAREPTTGAAPNAHDVSKTECLMGSARSLRNVRFSELYRYPRGESTSRYTNAHKQFFELMQNCFSEEAGVLPSVYHTWHNPRTDTTTVLYGTVVLCGTVQYRASTSKHRTAEDYMTSSLVVIARRHDVVCFTHHLSNPSQLIYQPPTRRSCRQNAGTVYALVGLARCFDFRRIKVHHAASV